MYGYACVCPSDELKDMSGHDSPAETVNCGYVCTNVVERVDIVKETDTELNRETQIISKLRILYMF